MINNIYKLEISVEEFLKQNLHKKRNDNEYSVCCPFCLNRYGKTDLKYKMGINLIKNISHCFRCGAIVVFNQNEIEKKLQFGNLDSIKNKIKQLGKPIIENKTAIINKKIILEDIGETPSLEKTPIGYKYLISRGINDQQIKDLNILIGKSDEYKGYIIFPFYNDDGVVDFIIGRNYNNQSPRYLNSSKDKGDLLYKVGIKENKAILCEGIFSAISVNKYTGIHSIAILGKQLSDKQLRKIHLNYKTIYYSLDGDVPKNQKMQIINQLISKNIKIINVNLPYDMDPDDLKEKYLYYFNLSKVIF